MRTIHYLTANNFGPLADVTLPLGDLNVLVGPNGAGKSWVLRVLKFLGDTARLDLHTAILRGGGFDNLRFHGPPVQEDVRLGLVGTVTEHSSVRAPDVYILSFSRDPTDPKTLRRFEYLKFKRQKGPGRSMVLSSYDVEGFAEEGNVLHVLQQLPPEFVQRMGIDAEALASGPKFELVPGATALATLRKLPKAKGAPQFDTLARLLESFVVYSFGGEAGHAPERMPEADAELPNLADDGENLGTYLCVLKRLHPEVFARIEADLAYIYPSLTGLELVPLGGAGAGVAVALRERAFAEPTFLNRASFGTTQALALLTLLHAPNAPQILAMEEPDHGLHPHALDRVVERLREASTRSQILVTTHSPALVNRLDPSEIIVCERDAETGAARIPAIEPETVKAMMETSGLGPGELWFSGALGGGL